MPVIRREPVPGRDKARLNRITRHLRIDPAVPDSQLHLIIYDAIMVLSGHSHLVVYATPAGGKRRAHLWALPGGRGDSAG